MEILQVLRQCIDKEPEVLATFGHPLFENLWCSSEVRVVDEDAWLVWRVEADVLKHGVPVELCVTDKIVGWRVTDAHVIALIPRLSTVSVRCLAYVHEYGKRKFRVGKVKLIGWKISGK